MGVSTHHSKRAVGWCLGGGRPSKLEDLLWAWLEALPPSSSPKYTPQASGEKHLGGRGAGPLHFHQITKAWPVVLLATPCLATTCHQGGQGPCSIPSKSILPTESPFLGHLLIVLPFPLWYMTGSIVLGQSHHLRYVPQGGIDPQ